MLWNADAIKALSEHAFVVATKYKGVFPCTVTLTVKNGSTDIASGDVVILSSYADGVLTEIGKDVAVSTDSQYLQFKLTNGGDYALTKDVSQPNTNESQDGQTDEKPEQTRNNSWIWWLLGGIGAVVLIGGTIVVILFIRKKPTTEKQ